MAALSSLYVELISTAKGFSVGFDQAATQVKAFEQDAKSLNSVLGKETKAAAAATTFNMGLVGSAMVGTATLYTGALVAMANHTAEWGEKLTDMAARTHTSVEQLQIMGFAAEQNGASMEQMNTALERVAKLAADAAGGGTQANATFNAMGIAVRDSNGHLKDSSTLLLEIADKFKGYADGAGETALASAIFGRSVGPDLVPMLNLGSTGIKELGDQLRGVNGIMTTEQAAAGDKFRDSLNLLLKATGGVGDAIGITLIPALTRLVEAITPLIAQFSTWLSRYPQLIDLTLGLSAALAGSGGLLIAVNSLKVLLPGLIPASLITGATSLAAAVGWIGALTAAAYTFRFELAAGIMTVRSWIEEGLVKIFGAAGAAANAVGLTGLAGKLLTTKFALEESAKSSRDMSSVLMSGTSTVIGNTKAVDEYLKKHLIAPPIIDKHRESKEKLTDAQKAANRIMEQERDEINKQGVALMNAEAAWMQYSETVLGTIPGMRRFRTEMQAINEEAANAAFLLGKNLAANRPLSLLPGGALEPPLEIIPPTLGGDPRTTGQWLELWDRQAKAAAEETRKLADAQKDVERSAGKVFDFLFLKKDKKDPSGDPLIQSVEALQKQGVALDANTLKWYEFAKAHSMQEGIDAEIEKAKKAAEEYAAAHRTIFGKLMGGIQTAMEAFGISLGRSLFQSMAGQIFGPLKAGFDEFFAGLLESLGLKKLLKGLGERLGSIFGGGGGGVSGGGGGLLGSLLGGGGGAAEGTGQATSAAGAVSSAAGGISSVASTAIQAAASIGGGIISALGSMRLEGTMNAVEYNTRAAMIHQSVMIDTFFHPWTGLFQWIQADMHVATTQLDAIYNAIVAPPVPGGAPAMASRVTTAAEAQAATTINNVSINVNVEGVEGESPAAFAQRVAQAISSILDTGRDGNRERWSVQLSQTQGNVSTMPAYG